MKTKRPHQLSIGKALGIALLLVPYFDNAFASTITFDTGAEGWSSPDTNTAWIGTGGNPGGYIRKIDRGPTPVDDNYIYAPTSFLGDWSALNGTAALQFDHRIFDTGDVDFYLPYSVSMSGPDSIATWFGATPSGVTDWILVSAPITASNWTLASGSWAGLLFNVTELKIQIEQVGNSDAKGDITGIDNIRIVQVPEPSTAFLLMIGAFALLRRAR